MSVLAILLPPRERLAARAAGPEGNAGGLRLPAAWSHVYSIDGRSVTQTGAAPASALPRADSTVLVLADADVSWHRIDIPKAPAVRLRAALVGVMEEELLDDDASVHFALAPDAAAGAPGWVAVTHRPRLVAALAALEAAGLSVAKVAAACQPQAAAHGHFHTLQAAAEVDRSATGPGDLDAARGVHTAQGPVSTWGPADAVPWLTWAGPDGVACIRLAGTLGRALQAGTADTSSTRWTATPAAAAAAERWLGAPVALLGEAERALEAAQAGPNLRQFDLAPRHRGTRALGDAAKRVWSREWRPVRAGVAALLLLHLVGLNAYAWQQQQTLTSKRATMDALLRSTHPGVRAVLDAPLQMQRETERLRVAAGRPGDNDFEALLGAAAAAWPDGLGPVQSVQFESGRLTLTAPGLGEPQMMQLRQRLQAAGFTGESSEGRVIVTRAAAAPAGAPA